MSPVDVAQLLALAVVLGAAVFTDVKDRRIPNGITLTGALFALGLGTLEAGGFPTGAALGMAGALALGFPAFALGAFGAGDAKLLAVTGAFLGIGGLPSVLLYAGVAGGLLGLLSAVRRGVLIPVLLNTRGVFLHAATLGRRGSRQAIHDPDARTIPYGVAIAMGAVLAWFAPLSLGGLA